MKDVPTSKPKPGSPRMPIVLRRGGDQGQETGLIPKESLLRPENPLKTIALPKIGAFVPTTAPVVSAESTSTDATEEIKKLKAQVEEYQKSLEAWAQAEVEWSGQRRLFKVMAETVSDIIVLMDRQGNRTWTNPSYHHLVGYEPQELAGTYALSEVHPEDSERATQALQDAVELKTPQQLEFRTQQKDGSWVHLIAEMVPMIEPNGQVESVVLMGHNVTETKQLEEALALASTQVTAAGMIEGMARDFDQILTNAVGNLTIAKNLNGPTNAVAVRLNEIERALQRARDLIEQMFSLSGHDDQPKVRVAVEPLVQEAVATVLKGTMIRPEFGFHRKLPELEVDVDAFTHAIRNIVTNSMQAMDKGVIRVSADFISQEQFKQNLEIPLKPGNYVCIRFQDQGHGIPEKILARVFEPYFTTRHGSQGLGLTTAMSAIQRLGGTITIDSTPSVGTTTYVYVPAAMGSPASPSSVTTGASGVTQPLPARSGRIDMPVVSTEKKRILLMDDEQMILDIVSRMLTHLGYEVKTCTDGSQAIAAYAKSKSTSQVFDVVLMDLVIPNGVGGQDAVHTIIKIDPNAKVIASSGHLDHPVMTDHKKFGFAAVLEKPYKLEKLQQVIEQVIGSAR